MLSFVDEGSGATEKKKSLKWAGDGYGKASPDRSKTWMKALKAGQDSVLESDCGVGIRRRCPIKRETWMTVLRHVEFGK